MSEKLRQFTALRQARNCFPKGERGRGQIREILETSIRTPEELIELRAEFAPGDSGQSAFIVIAYGNSCERKLKTGEDSNIQHCGNKAIMTLDIDVGGGEDHVPVCSKDCFNEVKARYVESMERQEKYDFSPSKNGWGRA